MLLGVKSAMATNPEFKKRVIDNGEKIEDVLKYLTKKEIESIYWTVSNLGKWGKNSGIATVLKYKTRIKNMINRVGELDKTFSTVRLIVTGELIMRSHQALLVEIWISRLRTLESRLKSSQTI